MSSAEENGQGSSGEEEGVYKRRRIQRACDVCRKKKVRCDGSASGKKCSNCTAFRLKCTYDESGRKRPPAMAYVQGLEERLKNMETLLQQMSGSQPMSNPEPGGSKATGAVGDRLSSHTLSDVNSDKDNPSASESSPGPSMMRSARFMPRVEDQPADPSDEEAEFGLSQLKNSFKNMSVSDRFFGKSSGVRLIKTAMDLKMEHATVKGKARLQFPQRRREFWIAQQWQVESSSNVTAYKFPDLDLLTALVDLYFDHHNVFIPLLHRPMFESALVDGLHLKDRAFGAVVLGVCACAARLSDDRRVLLEGYGDQWHSAGWKWYLQIQAALLTTPTVFDLQAYVLRSLFLQGSSSLQVAWTLVGIGLRLAQGLGAHRRRTYAGKPSLHKEMMRRAFWTLVFIDRRLSTLLGRSCAIQEEDFDLDYPLDIDDEHLHDQANLERDLRQRPQGISLVTHFICLLRLNQIMGYTLRTIYSINKSRVFLGFNGPDWEQHIVSELDSALNKWQDSVPDQLRWDPSKEDPVLMIQSANLYAMFYSLQILVHRPFMMKRDKSSPLAFPSLSICANAARSTARILAVVKQRFPSTAFPDFLHHAACSSGVMIMLNVWTAKSYGVAIDAAKEMEHVALCMDIIKEAESRWHAAGRLWDVMNELSSISTPLDELSLPAPPKRSRSPTETGDRNAGLRDLQSSAPMLSQETAMYSGLPGELSIGELPDDTTGIPSQHGYGPYLDVDALMASLVGGNAMNEQIAGSYSNDHRDTDAPGASAMSDGMFDMLHGTGSDLDQPASGANTSIDMIRNMWDADTLAQTTIWGGPPFAHPSHYHDPSYSQSHTGGPTHF
ncbi:hypothetical protein PENSPDRAFT_646069 [Peniophora sp. CONT]|nr:hypothetical protein PENSPDRAFT_646069 [Peniophora sp. CONT]